MTHLDRWHLLHVKQKYGITMLLYYLYVTILISPLDMYYTSVSYKTALRNTDPFLFLLRLFAEQFKARLAGGHLALGAWSLVCQVRQI